MFGVEEWNEIIKKNIVRKGEMKKKYEIQHDRLCLLSILPLLYVHVFHRTYNRTCFII